MKHIKMMWLEMIFGCLFLASIIIAFKNLWVNIDFFAYENPKILSKNDTEILSKSLEGYLDEVENINDCTAIVVVKDIQGYCLSSKMTNGLKNLGFTQADALLEHEYHSFIGVYSGGEVIYQHIGGDELIAYNDWVNNMYIVAKSGTWTHGNTGKVYIDGVNYSVNVRGINIIVIDNKNKSIIDSVGFDTHDERIPLYRLENGIVKEC